MGGKTLTGHRCTNLIISNSLAKAQAGSGLERKLLCAKSIPCRQDVMLLPAPSFLTCSHKASLSGAFYSRGSVQKGLPGRRSGCLQWLHCGFAGGRPACCSCSAGEGTVGHTPVGASPSFSGEMTENKEIKVRGWELGSPCSFTAIPECHLSLLKLNHHYRTQRH